MMIRVVLGVSALWFWFSIIYILCTRDYRRSTTTLSSSTSLSLKGYLQLLVHPSIIITQRLASAYLALSPLVCMYATCLWFHIHPTGIK
jgi:hypothetical protein